MAVRIWTGATGDGNFGTAGNYAGGVAPVNSDTVIYNNGNKDVSAGLTTALTGITLIATPAYSGLLGTSATALTFASVTLIDFAGSGATHNIGCSGTVTAAKFNHGAGSVVNLTSGTWSDLNNSLGKIVFAAAAVLTAAKNLGDMVIPYNGTRITTLKTSGPVTCYRNIQNTYIKSGGILTQFDNGTTTYTTASDNTGNVEIESNGVFRKLSGGAENTMEVFPGGVLSTEGNTGGSTGTVTLGTISKWLGAKTKVFNTSSVTYSYTMASVGGGGQDDN
jgi:hypothetical protein